MMKNIVYFFFFTLGVSYAQDIICSRGDTITFEHKMQDLKINNAVATGEQMVLVGKSFLRTPYVSKTLEVGTKESLVINFKELDCTTFVENVLAFTILLKKEVPTFNGFVELLKKIRYRDGVLEDYTSRLHYFTDWIINNEEKGFIVDVTNELGGTEVAKQINFMSAHRNLYPFLATNEKQLYKIKEVEKHLNREKMCVLLKEDIVKNEHLIKSGDIIALTTVIKGLDVTHTGIAVKRKKRIHLLHASTTGEVKISKAPLVDYLAKIKNNTGIKVARVVVNK